MVTQLEPDILEYEVKWALGNITNKASGGDELWTEFRNTEQEAVIKTNPEDNKCKKAK